MRGFLDRLLKGKVVMKNIDKWVYVSRSVLSGSKAQGEVRSYVLSYLREERKKHELAAAEKMNN